MSIWLRCNATSAEVHGGETHHHQKRRLPARMTVPKGECPWPRPSDVGIALERRASMPWRERRRASVGRMQPMRRRPGGQRPAKAQSYMGMMIAGSSEYDRIQAAEASHEGH